MEYYKISLNTNISHISSGQLSTKESFVHPTRQLEHYVLICGLMNTFSIMIENERFDVKPGTCLILPAGSVHKGIPSEGSVAYYWVHFSVPAEGFKILSQAEFEKNISLVNNILTEANNVVCFPQLFLSSNPQILETLFHQLIHIRKKKYYTSQAANTALTLFLIELTQQVIENYSAEERSHHSLRLSTVISWISANLENNDVLSKIDDIFQYNRHYLSSLFLEETGVPLKQYIINQRINKSKALLIKTDFPVKSIAEMIGYTDEKYFMRLFKSLEGLTPSQYRNAFFENHIVSK